MESVYWAAHGSSLLRCVPKLLRAELPNGRDWREEHMKETSEGSNYVNHVKEALKNVKGPVKYYDLTQQTKPDTEDYMDDLFEQPTASATSVPAALEHQGAPSPGAAPATVPPAAPQATAGNGPDGGAHRADDYMVESGIDSEARERVRIRQIAMDGYNCARRLDVLPPETKRPRMNFQDLDVIVRTIASTFLCLLMMITYGSTLWKTTSTWLPTMPTW
jgi:hypothetical protein